LSVEQLAREVCGRELRQEVVVHDDGSQAGMYDLRVGPLDAPSIAIECVRAVDPALEELWNIGPARGPVLLRLAGDWTLTLSRTARLKSRLFPGLEAALKQCEREGLENVHVDWWLKRTSPAAFAALERSGITWASCFRKPGSGLVYMTLDSRGGVVDEQGSALPEWIAAFLRLPAQADVLSKLARSCAGACHVFVPVGWGGAPWPVESYLTSGLTAVPAGSPDLPAPVGAVWIISMQASRGVRWDGAVWRTFSAKTDSIVT
jgi:hypothetical protein